MSFAFPDIHEFPPFYTEQPNANTLARQVAQWREIIVAYCAHTKTSTLAVDESALATPLFHNERIKRRLKLPFLRLILDDMVKAGSAEWVNPSAKTKALVLARSIAGWADALHGWAGDRGMRGAILTFFELLRGELDTPFTGLDAGLLLRVARTLEEQQRATVIPAAEGEAQLEEFGIKFL